jgi:amiloride-sensitive sodium channel
LTSIDQFQFAVILLISSFRIPLEFSTDGFVRTRNENLSRIPPTSDGLVRVSFNRPSELQLVLQSPIYTNGYEKCIPPSFLVHSPHVLPWLFDRPVFKQLKFGMTLDIVITPEIIRTEKSLRKLKPDERECYFEGEKLLRFFKTYSIEHCEEECFTNITLVQCKCINFNSIRGKEAPICSGDLLEDTCARTVRNKLIFNEHFSPRQNCSCLPLCNSIKYNIKYFSSHHKQDNETILNFRFNTDDIVVYNRYQQFTASDVVSYIGGLLGLFAGISFLSIFEFLYFVTLRLFVNVWRMFRN